MTNEKQQIKEHVLIVPDSVGEGRICVIRSRLARRVAVARRRRLALAVGRRAADELELNLAYRAPQPRKECRLPFAQ
jgi:hypothetical protein